MGTIKYSWFLKVLLEKWYSANQEASNVDKIKKNIKKNYTGLAKKMSVSNKGAKRIWQIIEHKRVTVS